MAKFDVYRNPDGPGYLLDCQADLLNGLNTRFVVPLLPVDIAPPPAERLNPAFEIAGQRFVMVTQFAGTIARKQLGNRIASLLAEDVTITDAIDMLLSGY